MPTRYKAEADHKPIRYKKDILKLRAEFNRRRRDLCEILKKECPAIDQSMVKDVLAWIYRDLLVFVLKCAAMPLRTPRMLMATVAIAANDPVWFLKKMDKLDPEAVARVVGTCGARSKANELALLNREIGIGTGPPPEEIRAAAVEVLARLRQDIANGGTKRRPKVELQYDLAISLGRRFVAMGGRLTRVTFDGETGPFHRLLEIVLVPTAKRLAKEAGFALTIRSMVRIAREDLRASNTLAP